MNNTVKVLPKKREHRTRRSLSLIIPQASMVKYRALWYSIFMVLYVWSLYWISCDIFVWHKPLDQVNMVNYAGSIVSIAFIWAGTKIWKSNRTITRGPQKEPAIATFPSNSGCGHFLGYLHQRQKSEEIPAECLTCKNVIQCFSHTK